MYMKKDLQRLTLQVCDETPEEESLAKIRALRRELKTLDDEFRQFSAAAPTSKPRVRGFMFPINNEDDLERLESTVITDPEIRNQYIDYLAFVKPVRQTVQQTFSKFFTDQCMTNYNWHGLEKVTYPRTPKRPMQKYEIFNSCMIEAWHSHGIDQEILVEQLKKTVYAISRRRYTKNQAIRKRNRLNEETAQPNEETTRLNEDTAQTSSE